MALSLQSIIEQPAIGWRSQLEQYIEQKQCFCLTYENAQEEKLLYTVRYAQIKRQEKRTYLNIWCEETEDIKNTDYPELIHNRCLRLDRIKSVEKLQSKWRKEGLGFCKVYLHFYGGMVKAYEAKDQDMSNEEIGDIRQVIRKVSNPFWLIREVIPYGKNCEIISPDNVREKMVEEVRKMAKLYGLKIEN